MLLKMTKDGYPPPLSRQLVLMLTYPPGVRKLLPISNLSDFMGIHHFQYNFRWGRSLDRQGLGTSKLGPSVELSLAFQLPAQQSRSSRAEHYNDVI